MLQLLPDLTDTLSLAGVKHAPSLGEGKIFTIGCASDFIVIDRSDLGGDANPFQILF